MNSLVIVFDETNERLYKVSIQESKTPKGQKRARTENELPLELTPQLSSISNNSTTDEAEEHQLSVIDERKQRRMISNRESARRSRMRKQKHLDELWSQVVRLRTENRELIDKLNHVLECHDRVLQENNQLREEASNLHQTLRDLQLNNPYADLQDMEEVPCNTAHLRAESTNQSIATSMDLLH